MIDFDVEIDDESKNYFDEETQYYLKIEKVANYTFYFMIKDKENNGIGQKCFSCFDKTSLNGMLEATYDEFFTDTFLLIQGCFFKLIS